jgi:hypothetical protein
MAVQRFVLDSTELDDAGFGLAGGAAFILDSSALDGDRVLDGGEFLTLATASSDLGGLDEFQASATNAIVTKFAVASAVLNGLGASAQANATKSDAVAVAGLGELDGSATAEVVKAVVAAASLGGLVASATTKVAKTAIGSADLGELDATATAQASPPPPPPPPPVDDGVGYQPYTQPRPRPKPRPKPKEIPVELNLPKQPRLIKAIGSSLLGEAVVLAAGSITFSILDDDAEVLLLI